MPRDRWRSARGPNQNGAGPITYLDPPVDPQRKVWQIVDTESDVVPTLFFQKLEEAEWMAARLNKQSGRVYAVLLVDHSKPLNPPPKMISKDGPDYEKDIVYSLLQTTSAPKYNITANPDGGNSHLNFLVRDCEGNDQQVSIGMAGYEMLRLAEYIFGVLANRAPKRESGST